MKIIKSKIFKFLVSLFIVGFILGIISYFIIDNNSLNDNIINYFECIKLSNFDYFNSFIKTLLLNYKYLFIIWVSGIILFSILFIPLIIIYRGISIGLLFVSLVFCYNIKGLVFLLILLVPCIIINEIIFIFMSYYSLNLSIKIYNIIKNNKQVNIKSFMKNYFIIYFIFLIILLISSIIEIYISSNIIKFVV